MYHNNDNILNCLNRTISFQTIFKNHVVHFFNFFGGGGINRYLQVDTSLPIMGIHSSDLAPPFFYGYDFIVSVHTSLSAP